MAQQSKWISGNSPGESVVEAACRALEARLDRVRHFLPLAATGPKGQTENVHQLRVWTRRAVSAMELFQSLLPPRRATWMNRQLKRIRRTAGQARDLDVFWQRFAGAAVDHPADAYAALLEHVKSERQRAQKPIVKIYEKLLPDRLPRRQSAMLQRLRLRTAADKLLQPDFRTYARKVLRPLVDDFLAAAGADLADLAALHAFRIQGKQLRYAMELFSGAFGGDFRSELYKLVESLQDKLGRVNDHATAQAYLEQLRADICDRAICEALKAMIDQERAGLQESRRQFLDWWTPDRRDELRRRFEGVLSDAS